MNTCPLSSDLLLRASNEFYNHIELQDKLLIMFDKIFRFDSNDEIYEKHLATLYENIFLHVSFIDNFLDTRIGKEFFTAYLERSKQAQ